MIGIGEAFSDSYAHARRKFLDACAAAGLAVQSEPHPLRGRDGEALAMDVALDGDAAAERLLLVTSGCHGVEGHCGSGVQVFALHDAEWRDKARAQGVAVLYVHALNPHGFSHGRRVTHENVDPNRNFVDFGRALPANPAYAELHPLLLPSRWPPGADDDAALAGWVEAHGASAYQAAMSGGQYQFEDGLFFGGKAPTWTNLALRAVLRRSARHARRLGWLDIHTGLGPSGWGERIFAGRDDAAARARARAWWERPDTPLTSIYDGSSSSPLLSGLMMGVAWEECAQAEITGMSLEFGTLPMPEVTQALRADHWMHRERLQGREPPAALAERIRADMRAAFYTDTDAWRGQIVSQSRQAMFQAVDGLAG